MHNWKSNLENDCIAILSYCYRNQKEPQSYSSLSEALNIPKSTLQHIIAGFREFGANNWALETYALKYGFKLIFIGKKDEIIWVDKVSQYDAEYIDYEG